MIKRALNITQAKQDGIITQATKIITMEDYILMYKTGDITLETLLELLGGYV